MFADNLFCSFNERGVGEVSDSTPGKSSSTCDQCLLIDSDTGLKALVRGRVYDLALSE